MTSDHAHNFAPTLSSCSCSCVGSHVTVEHCTYLLFICSYRFFFLFFLFKDSVSRSIPFSWSKQGGRPPMTCYKNATLYVAGVVFCICVLPVQFIKCNPFLSVNMQPGSSGILLHKLAVPFSIAGSLADNSCGSSVCMSVIYFMAPTL